MRILNRPRVVVLAMMFALFVFAPALHAQTTLNASGSVSLTAVLPESVSVAVSPSTSAADGNGNFAPITITVSGNAGSTRTQIGVATYFGVHSALLNSNGVNTINSDQIYASLNSSTPTPCTNSYTLVTGGTSVTWGCSLWQQTTTPGSINAYLPHSDTLVLSIPNFLTSATPGNYSGTLLIAVSVF